MKRWVRFQAPNSPARLHETQQLFDAHKGLDRALYLHGRIARVEECVNRMQCRLILYIHLNPFHQSTRR